jgi:hypothetical protein
MKPKDKAKELFEKYVELSGIYVGDYESEKEMCLIAINEVRWFHERLFYLTEGSLFDKYLDDVKQEIEKL